MKKRILGFIALAIFAFNSYGQTLFVPSGTSGIGTSLNGNIGIGTDNPTQKLHVNGTLRGDNFYSGALSIYSDYGWLLSGPLSSSMNYFITDRSKHYFNKPLVIDDESNTTQATITTWDGKNLILQTGNINRFTIDNAGCANLNLNEILTVSNHFGDVKIGAQSSNPSSKLDISSTDAAEITLSGNGSNYINAGLVLKSNSSSNYRGMGMFLYDAGGQNEWFTGRPYSTSDRFVIYRKDNILDHSTATAGIPDGNGGYTGTKSFFTILNDGKIGIGTDAPDSRLQVTSNETAQYAMTVQNTSATGHGLLIKAGSAEGNSNLLTIKDNNGTDIVKLRGQDRTLYVKTLEVTLNNFPDYVFENDYKLMSLNSLEAYIKSNKHLPNIPSAKEIEENGANIGELVKLQMEKIEELTLYLIQQQKELGELKQENMELKKQKEKTEELTLHLVELQKQVDQLKSNEGK